MLTELLLPYSNTRLAIVAVPPRRSEKLVCELGNLADCGAIEHRRFQYCSCICRRQQENIWNTFTHVEQEQSALFLQLRRPLAKEKGMFCCLHCITTKATET
jgi:hypothetical protein